MDVVVQIQGRDALPVRAVPFAGRWQWMSSPDGIASACLQKPIKTVRFETELNGGAKEVAVRNREHLPSFVLQSNGTVRPLHPGEWSFCAVELKGLEAKLRGEKKVEDESFASWRRQAIETLPAGVFVWLDDFKRWISDTCQPDCVDQEQDDDVIEEPTLQPLVPPELEGVLFEGLRSNWPRNRLNDEQSFVPLSSALADWFETPFDDLSGEQWYRVKTDFWPMPWDELSPNQRREVAAQWDYSHDPEAADERQRLWDLFCRQDALQREIREWEALKPQSITEKAEQTDRLLALREQERLLRVQLSSDPVASSAQDDRAQQQGEVEAVTQEPAQPVGVEPATNELQIPGKQPHVAGGKLAVKAAWEIELETKRAASVREVMKRLQSWADEGKEPEYLIRSDPKKRCVFWRTENGDEKDYGEGACAKTIKLWMESRR